MKVKDVKQKEYLQRIKLLTMKLLDDKLDFLITKSAIEEYKSILLEVSQLDLNCKSGQDDIQFENGIALGTNWAALCISDIMRTRNFIRGIVKAAKKIEKAGKRPIRILYAGSGPFATLVLPLIAQYSSEELQIIIMETNPKSIQYLQLVISNLGIENYFEKILKEDASKYKLKSPEKIDMLISETMQHGLVKEQQVPIMLNLVRQLESEAIVIPERISLELAFMNSRAQLIFENRSKEKYKVLSSLWNFDRNYIDHFNSLQKEASNENEIELIENLDVRSEMEGAYDKLVVLTSIQVYKDEWIDIDSSSLTIPKVLLDLEGMKEGEKEISIKYTMNGNPNFEYELK